jgi:hypothetical protein
MGHRKRVAWGLVLSLGAGLVVVLVCLWVDSAVRLKSLDDRIAQAEKGISQASARAAQLRHAPQARVTIEELPAREKEEQQREEAMEEAEQESMRLMTQLTAQRAERARQTNTWQARVRSAIRRYTGW